MREFKVLLVEDDDFDATLLKSHMSKSTVYKYNIHRAVNMEEALHFLHTDAFDVILLDLTLPDSSGFDTLTNIFKDCKEVPILILTSYDSDEFGIKAIELGAQDYLIKGETNPKFLSRCISHSILRKRVEESIIEEKKRALTHSELKTKYLANVTHEIRTPLNIITGLASALVETQLSEEQEVYLRKLNHSCDTLLYLVNDVLDLSKIEEGKFEIEMIPFHFKEFLDHLVDMMMISVQAKGLKLNVDLDKNIPQIVVLDPNRLTQVLINLLGNSVKFTSEGEITLTVKSIEQNGNKHKLYFSVADTGIGISSTGLKKIFAEYQQAQTSISRQFGGTGLGLSLSQKIVQIFGSKIEVESEEGKGSNFFFEVEVETQSEGLSTKAKSKKQKILICNESSFEINKFTDNIIQAQADVEIIEDARDILWQIKDNKTDLVIFTLNDDLKNINIINEIKSMHYAPPVIVLTEKSLKEESYSQLDKFNFNYLNLSELGKLKIKSTLKDILTKSKKSSKERENRRTVIGDSSYKVLLADDNVENHDLVRIFFRNIPIEMTYVDNGKIAYEEFQKNKYDLILMDMQMPIMDGQTAIKYIRDYEESNNLDRTPILAFTANAIKEQLDAIAEVGGDGHVLKPFKKWQLIQQIIDAIGPKSINKN